ncbi:MAG: Phenylalanine--tRNA ligase alpha subunit [Chlamydiae bacterium]|nr:Phenylalanine--tRNA ligase alpha subunit [Chlamydiota bacterium]
MVSIEGIRKEFAEEIQRVATSTELEAIKVKYLGRKGPLLELMKTLKEVSSEERPKLGKEINDLKDEVSAQIAQKLEALIGKEEKEQLGQEMIDVTLPGRKRFCGRKHVLIATLDHIISVLSGMGFSVQYGPDIDTDYYNFEALNFPPDHPSRDMQDTFYITEDVLLRTHTSNIQARVMEASKPPIRIIAPGKSYRNEAISARSHVFFYQVEAFYVDKGVTFADLLSTMDAFLEKVFNRKIETRYRPSYFPFVEPGMEVDVHCLNCHGTGCVICKHTGWLEVLGAGMVHPEVLKNGDIDPEIYSGFAWGLGVERLAMLKYGITDIRMFTENNLRFLKQFSVT